MRLLAPIAPFALAAALCGTSQAQTTPFDGCGTLAPGVTCPIFFLADVGGLYLLDADLSGYSIGDRVHVQGDLDPGCFTSCNQGDGCIFSAIVTPNTCNAPPLGTSYCGPAVPNSSGNGAVLSATGTGVAGDPFELTVDDLPMNRSAIMLASQVQDFVPGAGGSQGALCVGVPFARFNRSGEILNSGNAGSVNLVVDSTDIPLSPPVAVMAGETWYFQCWFRDANPMDTSNFSDGVAIAFL
ncbi:MAG: hypothetical protein GY711_14710 [bacterium]|nr:hypothetical protein [bacterium]